MKGKLSSISLFKQLNFFHKRFSGTERNIFSTFLSQNFNLISDVKYFLTIFFYLLPKPNLEDRTLKIFSFKSERRWKFSRTFLGYMKK